MRFTQKKGFTLIEVIMVLAIFMILLGAVTPYFQTKLKHLSQKQDEPFSTASWILSEDMIRQEFTKGDLSFSAKALKNSPSKKDNQIIIYHKDSKDNIQYKGFNRYVLYDHYANRLQRSVWASTIKVGNELGVHRLDNANFLGHNRIVKGITDCDIEVDGAMMTMTLQTATEDVEIKIYLRNYMPLKTRK